MKQSSQKSDLILIKRLDLTTSLLEMIPMAQQVKNPPAVQEAQETRVRSLDWEDSLEEGMATHSSILAWRIPWTEEPGELQSIGSQRVGRDLTTKQKQQQADAMKKTKAD